MRPEGGDLVVVDQDLGLNGSTENIDQCYKEERVPSGGNMYR